MAYYDFSITYKMICINLLDVRSLVSFVEVQTKHIFIFPLTTTKNPMKCNSIANAVQIKAVVTMSRANLARHFNLYIIIDAID